ncbi:MAG TPA: radical SAM protein [Armatimonadota bacterium]|nr:radical SAM protein [Armatimonadota bacterium]HQK95115.1 radical SAM protein [Armatimonadota bacterium]
MVDRYGRVISYLRISVTDTCNLRCYYCAPPSGAPRASRDPLRAREIAEVARVAASLGITKFRITGGEPTLRSDLPQIVESLAELPGLTDLAMTTNGTRLAPLAARLRDAGLRRVNVSLDSVDPARYREITGGGDLQQSLEGIAAAVGAGLFPLKLNCVVSASADEADARGVAAFAARHGYEARFIPRMDLASGRYSVVLGGDGGDCARCNRLRLTCDGLVVPCLFSDLRYSVRELGARAALEAAVEHKPARGGPCGTGSLYDIGG